MIMKCTARGSNSHAIICNGFDPVLKLLPHGLVSVLLKKCRSFCLLGGYFNFVSSVFFRKKIQWKHDLVCRPEENRRITTVPVLFWSV